MGNHKRGKKTTKLWKQKLCLEDIHFNWKSILVEMEIAGECVYQIKNPSVNCSWSKHTNVKGNEGRTSLFPLRIIAVWFHLGQAAFDSWQGCLLNSCSLFLFLSFFYRLLITILLLIIGFIFILGCLIVRRGVSELLQTHTRVGPKKKKKRCALKYCEDAIEWSNAQHITITHLMQGSLFRRFSSLIRT